METKSREAMQVSEPVANEIVYCISCEEMVTLERDCHGEYHSKIVGGWDGETKSCEFPGGYAYSSPDNDLPDDWAKQEPDDDQKAELELAEIGEWLGME